MCVGFDNGRLHVQHTSARWCHCVIDLLVELCHFDGHGRETVHMGTIPGEFAECHQCALCLYVSVDANIVFTHHRQTR